MHVTSLYLLERKFLLTKLSRTSPVAIHSDFAAWMAMVAARRLFRHLASGFWRDDGGKAGGLSPSREFEG